jgi:hypothetical protein
MVLALYPPANPHSSGNWMTALRKIHYMWQKFKIINLFKEMILLNFALSLLVPDSICEHFVAWVYGFLFYFLLFQSKLAEDRWKSEQNQRFWINGAHLLAKLWMGGHANNFIVTPKILSGWYVVSKCMCCSVC